MLSECILTVAMVGDSGEVGGTIGPVVETMYARPALD